ncbi:MULTISPECIES: HpcH/HpaI aldolase/citrate lyase family protein [Streptomyces]|uniref:ATP/GTP-binding protein n=1 Tax=Streptomyces griseus subsp. griseus (strain JCM 4626 / CBS 651.72 / NBRC 13350 / KCC S-0626 / ISP 5235) TaxID=455632 RepID=B1VYI2_STRGG|nr:MULTISPECIES: HpcH/HpaI aldolase/citrate lyase family protein [Streptomyces]MYR12957.1 HpcH/HpaI aldolase/citrate lyase family protein [Streptomyces sp. SID724]MYR52792.1 HpcH/HpaI aldolase/citrate lyase family protein [Streptomyces sp. SID4928]EGE44766.1 putative ATP/GTP-binding protein [Streptomyces sp. ACT-1]MBW3707636.1 ATP/GTP-binding protein [Streptomyces griseus]NEB55232.1 HpcH/HpaI aldolase/citrate lyase family protein [Streptomyces griseus]
MRHFGHISPTAREGLFFREPRTFTADSPARMLSVALGATLYSPATRPSLADDVLKQAARGVVSMVLCLEDSIDDAEVIGAESNLIRQFAELAARDAAAGPEGRTEGTAARDPHGTTDAAGADVPLLFVRVREPAQIVDLVRRLGDSVRMLSGFVLPKFTEDRGKPFLEALAEAESECGRRLFAMPVLESPELLHLETRGEILRGIARSVEKHRDRVLALRLGVTDFCSAYGLRRAPDMTAYDVHIVASVIADVVNVLGRADGTGFTITGPVWEYFRRQERMFKPQLRRSPFLEGRAEELRTALIEHDLDGLLREIELDRANGLLGKTCIHPSHVAPVHALSVVSHEEYTDAQDILSPERGGGGVLRSAYTNKMNEVKPHRAWAERTLQRAEVFGVAREDVGFVDLLAAGLAN